MLMIYLASPVLKFIMFADDTNVFMSNNSLVDLVNRLNVELEKVGTWFNANKLSLNVNKTNYISCLAHRGKRPLSTSAITL